MYSKGFVNKLPKVREMMKDEGEENCKWKVKQNDLMAPFEDRFKGMETMIVNGD